jgi:hypothetical protein
VRLDLSLAQFAYIVLFAIISCFKFNRKAEQLIDPNFEARNSFFYARNKLQLCQRFFQKDAVQSVVYGFHLFEEEADQLHRSQSTALKWKHV